MRVTFASARPLVRLVMAAAVMLPATAISAAETAWTRVTASQDGLITFYIDRAGIRGERMRTVRLLYDYRDVQQDPDTLKEHRSSIVVSRIDCAGRRIGMIRSEDFTAPMGRGKRESHAASGQPEMRPVAGGSIDAKIIRAACGGQPGQGGGDTTSVR